MALATIIFEFEGRGGALIAATAALVLMQCGLGRSRREQWRSMAMAGVAQFVVLGIVVLLSPVSAGGAVKAVTAMTGAFAISAAIYFFLWPRSNLAAFMAALHLQFEHTARCLGALSARLTEPDVGSMRAACRERERVRSLVAFNQELMDQRMTRPLLDTIGPVVRCMYDALECLAIIDRSSAALCASNSRGAKLRAGVAGALSEFSRRFHDVDSDPPSAAAMLGDLQNAACAALETDHERLLLLGTVFWMRRMDAVQRQFVRELAALPVEMIPQSKHLSIV